MFPTDINTHKVLHDARQRELEAAALQYRRIKAVSQNGEISPIRRQIGTMLIKLGTRVAQEPKQDVRLVLSARHQL